MNSESRVLLGAGAFSVIGMLLAVSASPVVGLVIIALALAGGVVGLRLTTPDRSDPFAYTRARADEANVGNLVPAEPLAPWVPDGGLSAWTPIADPVPPIEANPLDELIGLDHLDPVGEIERIEERQTSETERLAPITFDGIELDMNGNAVNERVTGADDIMAASQATELRLAGGEETELQRLLAKVQLRLSAYE